jgi:hypothetical protein
LFITLKSKPQLASMLSPLSRRQPVFHLQPDQEQCFANRAPIASHSVLTNVASIALLAAARRHTVRGIFVQEIRCTSLFRLDAAEPISAGIICSARQIASNSRELAAELDV